MPAEPERPFLVRIQSLDEGSNPLELSGTSADLEIDPGYVRVAGRIIARVVAFRAGEKIEVQGSVAGEVDLICDRCLVSLRRPIRAELRIFAERRETRDRRSDKEVREDDLGIVYHDGRFVDLTDEVRQVFLVEVPRHVRCREDCRGLCPHCGADLNAGPCGCAPRVQDHRWDALQLPGDDAGKMEISDGRKASGSKGRVRQGNRDRRRPEP